MAWIRETAPYHHVDMVREDERPMTDDDRKEQEGGPLKGLTVLRFTQATENKGGVEQYLDDLNHALLQRNSLKIVQLCMPLEGQRACEVSENWGTGVLVKIPMLADKGETENKDANWIKKVFRSVRIKEMIRDVVVYNPMFAGFTKRLLKNKTYSRYNREPLDVKRKLTQIFNDHEISLIVIHLAGGRGSAEVVREANSRRIPYVILNHFSNNWYKRIGFREQVSGAAGVGGVSKRDIPPYIRNVYKNLSDGIDTQFFKKEAAQPWLRQGALPMIMLPARVVPGKGHKDLIHAARLLKKKGIDCTFVFAGRNDDVKFAAQLRVMIEEQGLTDSMLFAGELTREELRRYYASSSIVVLPSHNEGLGRVLLEAQAMCVPVVAYDVGGVSEAVRDGVSGYLVKKGHVRDLAEKLRDLVSDDAKRAVLGNAGRRFVEEQFSFSALAMRHEEWYRGAMECRQKRQGVLQGQEGEIGGLKYDGMSAKRERI